jgi:hypothetical protein
MQATPWLSDDITLTGDLDDKTHDVEPTTEPRSTSQHQAEVPLASQDRGITEQYHEPAVCKAIPRRPMQVTKWIYS